jgi:hypothetical protein
MFWKSKPLWGNKPRLKSSYDAVIIGGGCTVWPRPITWPRNTG